MRLELTYPDKQCRALPFFGRLAPGRRASWSHGLLCLGLILIAQSAQSQSSDYPAVDCVIQPYKIVDLGSPVSGVIEKVLVERSDFVTAGQVVAQMEDQVERATVDLARARTEIDAQLQAETINLHYDDKTRQRIDSLYNRRVLPVENKDSADRESQLSTFRVQQVRDLQRVRNLELERAKKTG